jgi:hypothetical protein
MQNEITQLAIELFKQEIGRNGLARSKPDFEGIAKISVVAAESFYQQIKDKQKIESQKTINISRSTVKTVTDSFSALKKHFDWDAEFSKWNVYLNTAEIGQLVLSDCYDILIEEYKIPGIVKKLGGVSKVKRFNGVSKRCYVLPPLAKNEGAKS